MSKGVLCSPRTDAQTHRQTDTKVNTEGTLSGFQDFFLQPLIKDRPNNLEPELILMPEIENCDNQNTPISSRTVHISVGI